MKTFAACSWFLPSYMHQFSFPVANSQQMFVFTTGISIVKSTNYYLAIKLLLEIELQYMPGGR